MRWRCANSIVRDEPAEQCEARDKADRLRQQDAADERGPAGERAPCDDRSRARPARRRRAGCARRARATARSSRCRTSAGRSRRPDRPASCSPSRAPARRRTCRAPPARARRRNHRGGRLLPARLRRVTVVRAPACPRRLRDSPPPSPRVAPPEGGRRSGSRPCRSDGQARGAAIIRDSRRR